MLNAMYFDVGYWWRVLRHVWGLKHWPGRRRMLLRLLLLVPAQYLFNSLFFLLDYLVFPSLWMQSVRQPVFIVGHARSGTTLMHRLMSADGDRFSFFLYWEMFLPSLLQKKTVRLLGRVDRAVLGGKIHRALVAWDDKTFGPYRHMHHMSLWNAEEDCFAMQSAFVSQQWALDIPMMDVIDVFHVDQMGARRRRWLHHYRELVKRQLLFKGAGARVHLAKNPVMSGWVGALLEVFPDARFVTMIRDPLECIPSCLKLVRGSWERKGWQPADFEESLRVLTNISFEHFHNPRRVLAAHPATPAAVVDYRALIAAPRETVHAVYRELGMDLGEDYDQWLLAQSEQEKTHLSKFEYSLGEFEVSPERIGNELSEFYADFGWPLEGTNSDSR